MNNEFPQGIEIVCAAIILNDNGEVFLAKSPKWNDAWIFPGGHVDPGESILDSARREAKEETGLDTKPIEIVSFKELIAPPDFERPAHLISFRCLLRLVGGNVVLQEDELTEYKWLKPEDAFSLNLGTSIKEILQEYVTYAETHDIMPI